MVFLNSRLNDPAAFEWAAGLEKKQIIQREAIRALLWHPPKGVKEPYVTAWNLLLESWRTDPELDPHSKYGLRNQVKRFGPNGLTLTGLVDQVRPWLNVEARAPWEVALRNDGVDKPKPPKRPQDLARFKIDSGETIRLEEAGITADTPTEYLTEAFERIEGALVAGLRLALRIDEISSPGESLSNDVGSVRFGPVAPHPNNDTDTYRTGFAPAVKILDALLTEIARRNEVYAIQRLAVWRRSEWGIFRRLWAASATNPRLVTDHEVAKFLYETTDEEFWRVYQWKEIAILRAVRFEGLADEVKAEIIRRIRRGPPKSTFWHKLNRQELAAAKKHMAARELHRIAVKTPLPDDDAIWLEKTIAKVAAWEPLQGPSSDFDDTGPRIFRGFQDKEFVPGGGDVLIELQNALAQSDLDGGAATYIREHLGDVVQAIEASDRLADISYVLRFTAMALQTGPGKDADALAPLSKRFIDILSRTPENTLRLAIDTIAGWAEDWAERFVADERFSRLWLRLWPVAADATNVDKEAEASSQSSRQSLASLSLNTSAGRLFSAWRKYWPNLKERPRPFDHEPLRTMRAATIDTQGKTRRQVLHRYLQDIGYLQNADDEWAQRELLGPLLHSIGDDAEIWDAISRHPILKPETMALIGEKMADQIATPNVLSEEVRSRLAERLVMRILWDRLLKKEPSVKDSVIQQMLRRSSDGVRGAAARAVQFILTSAEISNTAREERFRLAVNPFFGRVWPKELTLRSKLLSDYLAQIPAECGEAFPDAVKLLERLLTPFDCWSLWEYRVVRDVQDGNEINLPKNPQVADAFLQLLDLTIGVDEGAVVPNDLDAALKWIRDQSRNLVNDQRYARLTALVRR